MINKKKKAVDIISLILVTVAFFAIVFLNIFQTDRPTVSESEKRDLAKMPEFSVSALADGSYCKDLGNFVSDTFYKRDDLVPISKRFMLLFGLEPDNSFILINGGNTEETSDETIKLPDEVLEALEGNKESDTETTEAETKAETEAESTVNETTEVTETVPEKEKTVTVTLNSKTVNIIAGSGISIYATVETSDGTETDENNEKVELEWTVSDNEIVSLTKNASGGVDLLALKAGTVVVTAGIPDIAQDECTVTVTSPVGTGETDYVQSADFLSNGLFIYGDAVYSQAFYSPSNSQNYASTAAYYKTIFKDARMNVVVAPLSSMLIEDPEIKAKVSDQKIMLDNLGSFMADNINYVDVYDALEAHKNEYLFFKSDHHWTARSAYYAYAAFAESVGLTPTPLENFEYKLLSESYHGSMYTYTQDERVKKFVDVIEAFMPTKSHTMTVYQNDGTSKTYSSCILQGTTYASFIAGDNPYTVINVPENPQDFNILVLKDSFGNSMVPFLCEHYGNIIIVDARYVTFNIYEALKDYKLSDVIFINNVQSPNSPAWSRLYLAAVGVKTEG